ncbi:LemA family protein [Roseateles terrae]|uniref:LemA protein n=1 Tax=Roseateles terrae TaxID=431060 RepID=A0ABR6GRH6_9BURK|nr:LemA family protein [Roseateles terrae]MBB3194679.1 LemA protein [Roseateles terrae]OWQ86033.1 hypothetical protein CDN98_15140 [Roseateles terrae]
MSPSLSPLPSSEDVSAAASHRARPRHGAVTGLARGLTAALVISAPLLLSGCGYNEFQNLDEQVNASWSEVLSQYQRRSDLIPNIVNTVKGEANFEQETLTRVVEARAKATSIQVTPELAKDPEALKRFQAAQGELSSALSRLLAVSEAYPTLQSNQGFRDLRVQLEGTENRITVARNRYIKSVQEYNGLARRFPTNLTAKMFGYDVKPNFTVQNEAAISAPPTVNFDKPATNGPAPAPAPAPGASASPLTLPAPGAAPASR